MTDASVNDPCECGQTTIRGCADMPSRHCGAWEQTTSPTFTAHELSALAEQGMTLTEAEETTVRDARGQMATDINALFSALRVEQDGLERDDLLNALEWHVERLRDDIIEKTVQHEQRVEKYWTEIKRLRADNARLRDAVDESYSTLAAAFNRIHGLARTSDTELAARIEATRAKIERARKATEASNGK
jgi:hypothetical protein